MGLVLLIFFFVCCIFIFCFCFVGLRPILPMALDCTFLIVPSVFSYVYLYANITHNILPSSLIAKMYLGPKRGSIMKEYCKREEDIVTTLVWYIDLHRSKQSDSYHL